MVIRKGENYLHPKLSTGVIPAAGREIDTVHPCCLDVNTKTVFLAKGRDGGVWWSIWMALFSSSPPITYGLFAGKPLFGLGVGLLIGGAMVPFGLRLIYAWRNDVPMRFNRQTRKVYFQLRGKLYTSDWDNIRAYLNVQHGVVYGGGRVRDPQVNIEFEDENGKTGTVLLMATRPLTMPETEAAASLWEYIRLYMEEGPEVLPEPQVRPRYQSIAEMRRDLDPFPIGKARRSWLADLLLFFPFRALWFAITFPTEIIYRFLEDRLRLVTPLLPEMEAAGRCTESEQARKKRAFGLLRVYDQQLEDAKNRIEALERSLLNEYDLQFVNPRGPTTLRFVDGIPEGWYPVPLSDLVEFNPWHRPKERRKIRYVPLNAVPERGMIVERDKLRWLENQKGRTFRNGDVLIPAVSPWLEKGGVGLVDFLAGYDLTTLDRTFLQRLDGYEVGVGSADFIVMRGTRVSPGFAYCIAKDPRLQAYVRSRMETSSEFARLPVSALAEFELPMPPPELLEAFEKHTARPYLRYIAQSSAEKQRLLFLRKNLLKNCPWLSEPPVEISVPAS